MQTITMNKKTAPIIHHIRPTNVANLATCRVACKESLYICNISKILNYFFFRFDNNKKKSVKKYI